jgi:hypothetical protein
VSVPRRKLATTLLLTLSLVVALAACGEKPQPIIVPLPSTTADPSPGPAGSPGADGLLPPACAAMASAEEVATTVGRTFPGAPREVPGNADQGIGRTGRIDCYYGVAAGRPNAEAPVTIGLATYVDDKAAEARVTSTINGEIGTGAQATKVTIGREQATLLTGTRPMLVGRYGSTTVVVSMARDVVDAGRIGEVLSRLADLALGPR